MPRPSDLDSEIRVLLIDNYEGVDNLDGMAGEDGIQLGDPRKAVDLIIDLIRGKVVAGGRQIPFQLPLGKDCCGEVKEECAETLQILGEWEDVIKGRMKHTYVDLLEGFVVGAESSAPIR